MPTTSQLHLHKTDEGDVASRSHAGIEDAPAGEHAGPLHPPPQHGQFPDPAWQGRVQFYELVFGSWLAYAFLVLMWQLGLGVQLAEWKYISITFLGASFYLVNHYFQNAWFHSYVLNAYSLIFFLLYVTIGTYERGDLGILWDAGVILSCFAFVVAFIAFESIARVGVSRFDLHEFWFMLASYFGFAALIYWRANAGVVSSS
eukprot:jgi/Mesvir1/23735/Mv18676-RA.1